MGLTFVNMTVSNPTDPARLREVEFLVDSGAVHSLAPREILSEIGIVPTGKQTFFMVDGTRIRREMGNAYFTYQGVVGASAVIFGEPGDEPLLGVTTLEVMALALHPFRCEIQPMLMRI